MQTHRAAALLLATLIPLRSQTTAAVDGTVTDTLTGTPIAGATVELTPAAVTDPAVATQTDAAGAFRFPAILPGDYTAAFEKHGYASLLSDFPVTQPVHVAGTDVHLQADLAALTTLRGRVLDNSGHPVPEIIVEMSTAQGQPRTAVTDSEGRYVIEHLRPGAWLLSAAPSSLPPPEDGMIWTHTWFPDITDRAHATPIRIRGGELAGFDIRLRPVQPHKVTGTVLDERGDPVPGVPVSLREPGWTRGLRPGIQSGAEGQFEFRNVPPGNWLVVAETKDQSNRKAITPAPIATRDLDNLRVRLAPPFTVTGWIEGGHAGHDPARVLLIPADRPFDKNEPTAKEEDGGRFQIAGIYPGRYRIVPLADRPSSYLASVQLGEREIFGKEIDLAPGSPPIHILYKSDGGRVRGTVEKGEGAIVALLPLDESQSVLWEFPTILQCGANGAFAAENLRPGDYTALAIGRLDFALYRFFLNDSDWWPHLAAQGTPVHVEQTATATIDLKLFRWPDRN